MNVELMNAKCKWGKTRVPLCSCVCVFALTVYGAAFCEAAWPADAEIARTVDPVYMYVSFNWHSSVLVWLLIRDQHI